jgi:hypothetical protein
MTSSSNPSTERGTIAPNFNVASRRSTTFCEL